MMPKPSYRKVLAVNSEQAMEQAVAQTMIALLKMGNDVPAALGCGWQVQADVCQDDGLLLCLGADLSGPKSTAHDSGVISSKYNAVGLYAKLANLRQDWLISRLPNVLEGAFLSRFGLVVRVQARFVDCFGRSVCSLYMVPL